jgi:hypothetical protein
VQRAQHGGQDQSTARTRKRPPTRKLPSARRCRYVRNNITEEILAEISNVDQSTISRYITLLTPLIDQATAEFLPVAEKAAEATLGAIALVDGTLWPCWSWATKGELWSGKHNTKGHGSLIIMNLTGRISSPPGEPKPPVAPTSRRQRAH